MSEPCVLTVRLIDALQPREREYDVPDLQQRGLFLRVFPSGVKSWALRYRFREKPRRLGLGRYPETSLVEARKAAFDRLHDVSEDIDPADVRTAARAQWGQTVQALYDAFAATAVSLRKSWPEKKRILERDVLPTLGDTVVAEIRRRDVTDLIHAKLKTGAPIAADHVLIHLSTLLAFAVDQEWITVNPCARLKKPSRVAGHRRAKRRALEPDALRTLWTCLDSPEPEGTRQFLSPALRDAFKVLLCTGQRLNEICSLKRDDVDLVGRWMLLRNTKNGDDHRVPLSEPVAAILTRRLASPGGPFVFANGDGGHVGARAKKAASRLSTHLGIDFESHDCRRTLATYLDRADFPEKKVAALVNHREALEDSTLRVAYISREYDEWKREAIAKWTDLLFALLKQSTPAPRRSHSGRVLRFGRG